MRSLTYNIIDYTILNSAHRYNNQINCRHKTEKQYKNKTEKRFPNIFSNYFFLAEIYSIFVTCLQLFYS